MSTNSYIVVGPQAVVIVGGKRRYLGRGSAVPDGVDKARLAHLIDVGLVKTLPNLAEVILAPDVQVPPAPPVEPGADGQVPPAPGDGESADGLDGLTVAELRDLAAERGIDLGGATRSADIKAAIQAATTE